MNTDRMIGKVTRVKSHQAQVELSTEIQSYSRGSYRGIYPIAASGVPFSVEPLQSKGDIIADMNEDLAADDAIA